MRERKRGGREEGDFCPGRELMGGGTGHKKHVGASDPARGGSPEPQHTSGCGGAQAMGLGGLGRMRPECGEGRWQQRKKRMKGEVKRSRGGKRSPAKGRRKGRNEGGGGERWNEGHGGEREVVKGRLSAPLCY